jgi:hypothetical protein
MREEGAGRWRRLHNEELHNLDSSPNIIRGRDHSDDLDVDFNIILERILGNRVGRCGLDSSGIRYRPMGDSCEHDNEPSGSTKGGGFLD